MHKESNLSFYEAYEKKCIMIINPKKHMEFKKINKLLEQHFVMLYDEIFIGGDDMKLQELAVKCKLSMALDLV